MNYGDLVRRPFEIVARQPYLWLLGFLAGGATTLNYSGAQSSGRATGSYAGPTWDTVHAVWNANLTWIIGVLVALAITWLIVFVLGCIATGGIIHAAVEHDQAREYRLASAWKAGYATGWRIAGLRILAFLLGLGPVFLGASLALASIASTPATPAGAAFAAMAMTVFVLAVAFWIWLSVAFELAQRLIVLEDRRVAESLSTGFRMVLSYLGKLALGWIILLAIGIGFGLAIAIVAVVVGLPALAVGFAGWAVGGWTGAVVAGSFAAVFFLGVVMAAGGAFAAYSSVYWTLLFKQVRALPAPVTRDVTMLA